MCSSSRVVGWARALEFGRVVARPSDVRIESGTTIEGVMEKHVKGTVLMGEHSVVQGVA